MRSTLAILFALTLPLAAAEAPAAGGPQLASPSGRLHLRLGDHRITVTGAGFKGADGESTVHVDWGTASLFSVQPGACHRRFGQYPRGKLAWLSPETDERWFPIADEDQVIRIPCVDLPPRPKALLRP